MNEPIACRAGAPADGFPPLSPRTARFGAESKARCQAGKTVLRAASFDHAFFGLYARRPYWERWARSMAFALEAEPVRLFADEELVGLTYQIGQAPAGYRHDAAAWAPYCPWTRAAQAIAVDPHVDPYMAAGGAPGHVGWHWERVLAEGVDGVMADLRERLAHTTDVRARRLYRGALILWRAVLRWNDRHVAALRERLAAATGAERTRLERLVDICSRVPRHPARTFHEAVQAFHLQHLALMFENPFGGNGPGWFDHLLWPYLRRDLAEGLTTEAAARELLEELFIRFEERLWPADGWVEAIVVGGTRADGHCAANPLSRLVVQTIVALRQTHPVVYPRLARAPAEDYLDLCVGYLLHGENRAQIYNDSACLQAIEASGVPAADARSYMAGGCMEISVQGLASDLNFTRTHNVAKTLELVLNGGLDLRDGRRRIAHDRDLAAYGSFDELYAAFEAELAHEYRQMVACLDTQSACFARWRPCYLLSSLVDDCLERGRDQQDGGARYHDYGFAPLAVTTAADSLSAIRTAVFEERFVTAADLLAALRTDFQDREALRLRLRNLPKYGQQQSAADALCSRVLGSVCRLACRPPNRFGGHLKPMLFNFVWTPEASRELGARAEGARAGEPIGHGMTPQGYAMTRGITAALNSCTSLDFSVVSGGATTMWDMDVAWIDAPRMKAILQTFLRGGGMIFQGNTTNVRELEAAYAEPAKYPGLIVRVGGFSARFVSLDRAIQAEIISRRRHGG